MDHKEAQRLVNLIQKTLKEEITNYRDKIKSKSEEDQVTELSQYVGLTITALITVLAHLISSAANFEDMLQQAQEQLQISSRLGKYGSEFHKEHERKRDG